MRVVDILEGRDEIPSSSVAVLLRAVRDKRVDVRAKGVRLLHKVPYVDASIANALREALKDPEESVRIAALQTIGQLGPQLRRMPLIIDETSVDAFVPPVLALLRDRDKTVRLYAGYVLCRLGYSTDAAIREMARCLADLSDETSPDFPIIVTSYNSLLSPSVEARVTLGQCGKRAAFTVPLLIKGLEHPESTVRRNVAYALQSLGPIARPAIPALAGLLKDGEESRKAVVAALSSIGKDAVPVLRRALEGKDAQVKLEICMAIHRDTPAAKLLIPTIERLLSDTNDEVCRPAMECLLNLHARGGPLRKTLTRQLESEDEFERAIACDHLAEFGTEGTAAIPSLKLLLLDTVDRVRGSAAAALWAIDPKGEVVLPSVLEMVADKGDPHWRSTVLVALGKMGTAARPALERVRAALKDRSEAVRGDAALALWQISGRKEEAVAALEQLVRKGAGNIRVSAVEKLRLIEKKREQLDLFVRLLEAEGWPTRLSAKGALLAMGEEAREVLPAVRKLTKHRSYRVRESAVEVVRFLAVGNR